jgi:hypothetical protein
MKHIEKALLLESIEEIEEEIKERSELRQQMVGRLYPSILYSEICQLNIRCSDLRKLKNE